MNYTYYTYYSYEEWGRGYIGKRKCPINKTPETDNYFGSYSDKTFNPTSKIILGLYSTDTEALEDEIILHNFYEVDVNPHFANRVKQKSKGFSTTGLEPWNKGLKGAQKAWNKGLKGAQKAWNKGLKGTGEKYLWKHPNIGLEYLSVACMCEKYPELIQECLFRLKNKKIRHHKSWIYLGNQQPDE